MTRAIQTLLSVLSVSVHIFAVFYVVLVSSNVFPSLHVPCWEFFDGLLVFGGRESGESGKHSRHVAGMASVAGTRIRVIQKKT